MNDLQEKQIINRFDSNNLKSLKQELNESFKDFRDKYNLSVNIGNCTYDSEGTATFKLELAVISDNGIVMTTEANNYIQYKEHYGLKPELGEIFVDSKQKVMIIIGLKPGTKLPVLYQDRKTLKQYKGAVEYVNSHFL